MREHTLPEQPVVPVIPPRRIIATVDALPQCAHVLTFPDTSSTGRFAKPRAASEKSDPSPTGLRPTSRIVFAGIGWFASIATDSRSCRRTAASKSLRDRRPRFVFRPATALPRAALGPFCTGPSSGVYRAHPDASLWTAGTRQASSRRSAAPHRDQASRSPSGSFDRRRPREMESGGKIPVARPSKQRHRAFTYGGRPPIITAQSSCSREHRSEVRRWRN